MSHENVEERIGVEWNALRLDTLGTYIQSAHTQEKKKETGIARLNAVY